MAGNHFYASSRTKRGTTFIAMSYIHETQEREGLDQRGFRSDQFSPYLLKKQFCGVGDGKLSHALGAFAIRTPTPVA